DQQNAHESVRKRISQGVTHQPVQRIKDPLGLEVSKAVVVPEATGTVETWTAVQPEAHDLYLLRQRRGEVGGSGAVDGHQRPVERGGHMHEARVVADHGRRAGHQVDRLGQAGFAGEVDRFFTQTGAQAFTDLFAHGVVLLRTKQPNLPAVAYLLVRYRSVVLRRPALGLAELGAWAQHQDRSVELEPKPLYRGVPAGRVDLQTRTGIGAR